MPVGYYLPLSCDIVLVSVMQEKNCGVLSTMMQAGCQVVDVRTKVEFKENAVKSAVNLPLDGLLSSMDKLDK